MRMLMYDSGIAVHRNEMGSYPIQLHQREPHKPPLFFVSRPGSTLYPSEVGGVKRP